MKRYLFEEYKVGREGDYHLISSYRCDENGKRRRIADIKRKGYSYDKKTKEYVYIPDPTEDYCVSKYVWDVKSFNI